MPRQQVSPQRRMDRTDRVTARGIVSSVQNNRVGREDAFGVGQIQDAKTILAQQRAEASAMPISGELAQKKADAAAKANEAKANRAKQAEADGWELNKMPIMQAADGSIRYDINKIGEMMGMSPAQVTQAQGINFGKRQVDTDKKLDDLMGGNNQEANQSQWNQTAMSLSKEGTVLNNLAQLDPYEAKVDFSNQDHAINLSKAGYMSDIGSIDADDRLNAGQGPTGAGKYAQKYVPMAVSLFAGLINPAAGVAMSTAISAAQNENAGGDWGDWAKGAAVNAGLSVAGS
jgi:hypothetical protein